MLDGAMTGKQEREWQVAPFDVTWPYTVKKILGQPSISRNSNCPVPEDGASALSVVVKIFQKSFSSSSKWIVKLRWHGATQETAHKKRKTKTAATKHANTHLQNICAARKYKKELYKSCETTEEE